MAYVIYNLKTLAVLSCRQAQRGFYDSIGAAKGTITRVEKAATEGKMRKDDLKNFNRDEWAIADLQVFISTIKPKPKMITVINLMSGKPIQIPEDTPRCCDPSTELYWSM